MGNSSDRKTVSDMELVYETKLNTSNILIKQIIISLANDRGPTLPLLIYHQV